MRSTQAVPAAGSSHSEVAERQAGGTTDRWSLLPRLLVYRQELLLVGVLILLSIVFSIIGSGFLTSVNITGTLQAVTETATLAIAETYVIVTGGIDLSVGATLGLSGVVGAIVMAHTASSGNALSILAGIAAALAVGLAMGAANAFMVVTVKITSFIATLATLGVGTGLTLVFTNGLDVQGTPGAVATIGNQIFAGVLTTPIIVTLAIAIVAGIYLHYSRFGRWTFAVGSNASAARGAGIPVKRHLVKVYMLAGLISSVAGVLDLMRLGTGSPTAGDNSELNAIAAVVIGGASLFGGVGTMVGSILGSIVLGVVLSGLVLSGVQPYWQTVVTGLLIAAAVAVQHVTRSAQRS